MSALRIAQTPSSWPTGKIKHMRVDEIIRDLKQNGIADKTPRELQEIIRRLVNRVGELKRAQIPKRKPGRQDLEGIAQIEMEIQELCRVLEKFGLRLNPDNGIWHEYNRPEWFVREKPLDGQASRLSTDSVSQLLGVSHYLLVRLEKEGNTRLGWNETMHPNDVSQLSSIIGFARKACPGIGDYDMAEKWGPFRLCAEVAPPACTEGDAKEIFRVVELIFEKVGGNAERAVKEFFSAENPELSARITDMGMQIYSGNKDEIAVNWIPLKIACGFLQPSCLQEDPPYSRNDEKEIFRIAHALFEAYGMRAKDIAAAVLFTKKPHEMRRLLQLGILGVAERAEEMARRIRKIRETGITPLLDDNHVVVAMLLGYERNGQSSFNNEHRG